MPADGRAPRGFTLTELLAVLAIVLIVAAGSISVWLAMAGTVAPGQATSVVQAMLVGAREYAVSNGVMTRVVFENDLANIENGTTMYLEYDEDSVRPLFQKKRVPGRGSLNAGRQVFVLKGAPPNLPSAPSPADPANLKASDVEAWQKYRDDVSEKLAQYATGSSPYLGNSFSQDKFWVTFDATGTLSTDATPPNPNVLTIIQVPGAGRRVGEHQFYVLNVNTGTQLVFD
ncbi:MAG: type II secretion system protein [Phycisphaerae bacterium]